MTSNKNGFTLIEMVLYVGVAAIMLSSITSFFFLFIDARIRNTAQQEVEYQGGRVVQFIEDTIQQSSLVSTPIIGVDSEELVVTLYDGTYGDRHLYVDNGTIMVEDLSGVYALTPEAIYVSEVQFQQVGGTSTRDSIQVTFTLSTASSSGQSAYSYEDTFTTTITRR